MVSIQLLTTKAFFYKGLLMQTKNVKCDYNRTSYIRNNSLPSLLGMAPRPNPEPDRRQTYVSGENIMYIIFICWFITSTFTTF